MGLQTHMGFENIPAAKSVIELAAEQQVALSKLKIPTLVPILEALGESSDKTARKQIFDKFLQDNKSVFLEKGIKNIDAGYDFSAEQNTIIAEYIFEKIAIALTHYWDATEHVLKERPDIAPQVAQEKENVFSWARELLNKLKEKLPFPVMSPNGYAILTILRLYNSFKPEHETVKPAIERRGNSTIYRNTRLSPEICKTLYPSLDVENGFSPEQVGTSTNQVVICHTGAGILDFYQNGQLFHSYSIASGGGDGVIKQGEGDRVTPPGIFLIRSRNARSQYTRGVFFNYPNREYAQIALDNGLIDKRTYDRIVRSPENPPQDTPLGGLIAIHGPRQSIFSSISSEQANNTNWTDGCIAFRTVEETEEFYKIVKVLTPVVVLA